MINYILIILIIVALIFKNVEKMSSKSLDLTRLEFLKKFKKFNINNNEMTLGELNLNNIKVNLEDNNYRSDIFKRGMIVPYTLNKPPNGWAICDGNNGTPDLKSRFIVGAGHNVNLSNRKLHTSDGSETHTLTIDEMPSHSHSIHILKNNNSYKLDGDGGGSGAWSKYELPPKDIIKPTGSGEAHNNMPPYVILNYIMKL